MAYTGAVPDTAVRHSEWRELAACRGEGDALFYEQRYESMAKSLCVIHCPVRRQCLADAMAAERGVGRDHRYGIFAALDGKERWRLDPTASGHVDDGSTLLKLDGPRPECGTYEALVRHLARGEQVDDRCWSREVRRIHGSRSGRRQGRIKPEPEPVAQVKSGPECGTEQAWYLHRRRKQNCAVCEEAHAELLETRRREILADEHVKGGSERGYMIHRRLGEPPCDMCTEGARRDREARLQREARRSKREGLTARERRVRDLWEQSLSDSEIARRVGISRAGVANIRRRLGLLPNLHARKAS
ncbi:WhiB family transcriptional regulator [Streptomyces sp. UG1]|uniref:WhiB family transcriptional regulator n=1 Tax=Streptomyces sp. UG1 TaxID=3417652 RepID=UPI003CF29248